MVAVVRFKFYFSSNFNAIHVPGDGLGKAGNEGIKAAVKVHYKSGKEGMGFDLAKGNHTICFAFTSLKCYGWCQPDCCNFAVKFRFKILNIFIALFQISLTRGGHERTMRA